VKDITSKLQKKFNGSLSKYFENGIIDNAVFNKLALYCDSYLTETVTNLNGQNPQKKELFTIRIIFIGLLKANFSKMLEKRRIKKNSFSVQFLLFVVSIQARRGKHPLSDYETVMKGIENSYKWTIHGVDRMKSFVPTTFISFYISS
jgi:hypothetical protein